MSITVLQKPSDIQPAQSPIVFSVITSGSQAYTASEFQYTANLYVWSGAQNQSGSYLYQARKYPNQSGSGIFDFSRMINSTLTELAGATNQYINLVKNYKVEFGWQYESGSTYVTQSGGLTAVSCSVGGAVFQAYDGYAVFPETINTPIEDMGGWPWLTDAWTVTQSVTINDTDYLSGGPKQVPVWGGSSDTASISTSPNYPYNLVMSASYINGATTSSIWGLIPNNIGTFGNTANTVYFASVSPGSAAWPTVYWPSIPTASLDKYSVYFINSSGSQVGPRMNFIVECVYYYEPIRITWKNKYGTFDWLNFYKRHDNQFNTDQRIYQPQLGSWNSSTLSYSQFQTRQQRYIVDATEVLTCNTNWLEEGYNELMKQLLVSDEIYWCYDQTSNGNYLVKPLTIQTNSLLFKTNVNNKLIQYTLTFDIGQPFKLIL